MRVCVAEMCHMYATYMPYVCLIAPSHASVSTVQESLGHTFQSPHQHHSFQSRRVPFTLKPGPWDSVSFAVRKSVLFEGCGISGRGAVQKSRLKGGLLYISLRDFSFLCLHHKTVLHKLCLVGNRMACIPSYHTIIISAAAYQPTLPQAFLCTCTHSTNTSHRTSGNSPAAYG